MQPIRIAGLFVSLWVTLVLAAAARAVVSGDPHEAALSIAFWALVYGAGLLFARKRSRPPDWIVTNGVAAIGMLACIVQLLTAGLLQALMSLALWLQAAKNPALTTRRDAYFALGISLALVAYGASEARASAFVLLLAAYGLSAIVVLVHCHQQAGLEREAGDAPASRGPIPSLSLVHLGALSIAVFAIALLWYLLVPRPDPVHFGALPLRGGEKYSREDWEREARHGVVPKRQAASKGTGASAPAGREAAQPDESLDITRSEQSAPGVDPNAIVMYVQSDRPLYLRLRSFDRFENDRWSRTDTATRKLLPADDGRFALSPGTHGEKVEYLAQVVGLRGTVLPLSAHAVSLSAPASVIAAAPDGAVFLPAPLEPGFRYGAVSLLPLDQPRPVARDAAADRSRYLQLADGFSPRIVELAGKVSSGARDSFGKALALESHLRRSYAYSFETVFTSQGVTPLEGFLFQTRRGHCEFFASAMAAMLRAIGVPSRVVHGYLAHNLNPVTGFHEVRAFDGHAWVEAYIDGAGWMTFEPTAAYPVPQRDQQSGTTLFDLKSYTERLALQEALQGNFSATAMIAALVRELAEAWHALVFLIRVWLEAIMHWVAANALALTVVVAALAAAAFLGYRERARLLWLWARIVLSATPRAKVALTVFRQLQRIAAARELAKLEGETVEEYLDRVERTYADLHAERKRIEQAFNATRYGGKTLDSAQANEVLLAFDAIGARISSYQSRKNAP